MLPRMLPGCVLLVLLFIASMDTLVAQAPASPLPRWHPTLPASTTLAVSGSSDAAAHLPGTASGSHSHTMTGLLIGGLVGAAATGVFLAAFCSGSDNACGADEVGRAIVIFAVPPAVVGAVIGSLIRTKD